MAYHPEKFALEPSLQLTESSFHTNPNSIIFGAIGDSAPDRWGRVLMRRAETLKAKNKDAHWAQEGSHLTENRSIKWENMVGFW